MKSQEKVIERVRLGVSTNVLIAGIASLLTDISSEMIYPILPLFLANVLNTPKALIGLIESVAESTPSIFKVLSGWWSDRTGKRKPLIFIGYGLSNTIKPLLGFAGSWPQVLLIRFFDRLGKGVRTAPRDALIGDVTDGNHRGRAFGFHRAMDTVGAAVGPLLAFYIMSLSKNNFRLVFWLTVIPGVLAVFILGFFLRESFPKALEGSTKRPRISFGALGWPFIIFTIISAVFMLGNSSDAFLILRAQNLGLAIGSVILLYFMFNIIYAILATPAGVISDRIGRRKVILAGFLVFALIYFGFAIAKHPLTAWVLFVLYGVYYALTEGVQRALVADLVPAELRGTAMGTFNFSIGLAALPASFAGGLLWDVYGPAATFYYGAAMALLASFLLIVFSWPRQT